MNYKKLIVFYFSGTGNAKNVASWTAAVAAEKGIEKQVINIAVSDRRAIAMPDPEALVVFISPVHGFNYPPVMLHFIARFPKGKNNVVLMNTRAGMLIGRWITPGMTGIAFYLSALILGLKGYSIKGMIPVDMPSNWISVHPGLNERTVKYLHEKNKERVTAYADKILSGGSSFKAVREIIIDLLISPVSFLYYFAGRFVFAKTYFASAACNNCDICIRGCPVKAIIKVDRRPFWTFNCESCMKCMGNCPKKAIETAHGFIIGIMFVNSSLLIGLFYFWFDYFLFPINNEIVRSIVETLLLLATLGISYRIIHYCMRFRRVERLMVYTSLTKYKWWGRRYKALKVDQDLETDNPFLKQHN